MPIAVVPASSSGLLGSTFECGLPAVKHCAEECADARRDRGQYAPRSSTGCNANACRRSVREAAMVRHREQRDKRCGPEASADQRSNASVCSPVQVQPPDVLGEELAIGWATRAARRRWIETVVEPQ